MSTSTQNNEHQTEPLTKALKTKDPIAYLPITEDLGRLIVSSKEQWLYAEELNFRSDSGYSIEGMYLRVIASIDRAFGMKQRRPMKDALTMTSFLHSIPLTSLELL